MIPEQAELEKLYAYPAGETAWVRSNFVSTLDGAAYDESGMSGSLGGDVDTRVFALLRSLADVIVVGVGTARTEGYEPVRAEDVDADLRERLGLAPVPPIAVVSRRLDIPDVLRSGGQLLITTSDAPGLDTLSGDMDVLAYGEGVIDWPAVLAELARRGLRRVLCEGGPTLHGTLVGHDLIDDLCLTIAPVLAAGAAPRIAHGPEAVTTHMQRAHVIDADGVLLTRWVRSHHV
ncbi:bifunctional diaminohydroxyphosphoribosylaminopyrimidine deaminase/5-amino-6-(5-phosphoribosylamino)uracil reductase [Aeromicrobium panaciterrae]|uniref:pyrimidine reductase family protein n=1 Tax=Aeromicrobium panaciterrae TaxID=363861 RepID=UPI0031DD5D5F